MTFFYPPITHEVFRPYSRVVQTKSKETRGGEGGERGKKGETGKKKKKSTTDVPLFLDRGTSAHVTVVTAKLEDSQCVICKCMYKCSIYV